MSTDSPENVSDKPEPGPYEVAVSEYLAAATWLVAGDAPFKVHARSIARSLDQQIASTGLVQSALAGSFDKVMVRLEARRPPAPAAPTDPHELGPGGTDSIFNHID